MGAPARRYEISRRAVGLSAPIRTACIRSHFSPSEFPLQSLAQSVAATADCAEPKGNDHNARFRGRRLSRNMAAA